MLIEKVEKSCDRALLCLPIQDPFLEETALLLSFGECLLFHSM